MQVATIIRDDLLRRGFTCHQVGDLQTAEGLYRQVLLQDPGSAMIWHLLGLLQHQSGQNESAVDSLKQAVEIDQGQAIYHESLGLVHEALGQLASAEASLREAIALEPALDGIHYKLGMLLAKLGRLNEARAAYEQALTKQPGRGDILFQLGELLWQLGEKEMAAQYFEQVIKVEPARVEAYRYVGLVQKQKGQFEAAIASFQQAIDIAPEYAAAYNNLGAVLGERGNLAEAIKHFRHATQLATDFAEAHYNLAVALEMQDDFAGAMAGYGRAVALKPGKLSWRLKKELLVPPLAESRQAIAQSRAQFETTVSAYPPGSIDLSGQSPHDFSASSLQPPLELAYHGHNDRALKEQYARLFRVGPVDKKLLAARRNNTDLYKLGFVVTRGHERGFNFFVAGLLNHLDQTAFQVTVICPVASIAQVKSAVKRTDIEYLTIPECTKTAARLIKQAGLDLLYFWEVGTDPLNYFLPFFRLAPVQCTSWGTPETTGIPEMDYYISSELFETAGAVEHYSEQLVKLNTLPSYYYRPNFSGAVKSRAAWQLSEAAHIYLCPQNLRKFHPKFDEILGAILRWDDQGELVLVKGRQSKLYQELRDRFQKTVPDVVARIKFVERQSYEAYLGLVAVADVVLDTLYFGGGATSLDILAVGTPIVTWPGEFMRGRMTYGCYQRMSVLDSVVWSAEAYAAKAVQIATDREYQAQVRAKILARSRRLFEDVAAVRELEKFFRWAIDRTAETRGRSVR